MSVAPRAARPLSSRRELGSIAASQPCAVLFLQTRASARLERMQCKEMPRRRDSTAACWRSRVERVRPSADLGVHVSVLGEEREAADAPGAAQKLTSTIDTASSALIGDAVRSSWTWPRQASALRRRGVTQPPILRRQLVTPAPGRVDGGAAVLVCSRRTHDASPRTCVRVRTQTSRKPRTAAMRSQALQSERRSAGCRPRLAGLSSRGWESPSPH